MMTNDPGEISKEMVESWLELAYGDPERVEEITLPVLSGSMAPEILPGENIVIKRVSPEQCRTGDIVVFRQENKLTAHRMLLKVTLPGGTFIFQKGDSNRFGNWLRSDRIVGIVTESETMSGARKQFLSESYRKRSGKKAHRQLFRDCLERILYVPRLIFPSGVKSYIKHYFHLI